MIWLVILRVVWRLEGWALQHLSEGTTVGGDVIWLHSQAK